MARPVIWALSVALGLHQTLHRHARPPESGPRPARAQAWAGIHVVRDSRQIKDVDDRHKPAMTAECRRKLRWRRYFLNPYSFHRLSTMSQSCFSGLTMGG